MRRLIEIATERRVTISMLMVAIVLFGMVSLSRLKLNLLPDISYPTVTIRTELTGAAPVEVENLLTKPIEEAVGVIRNVRLVRSVSRVRPVRRDPGVPLGHRHGHCGGRRARKSSTSWSLPLEASRPLLLRFDPVLRTDYAARPAMHRDDAATVSATDAPRASSKRCADSPRTGSRTDLEAEEGTAAVKGERWTRRRDSRFASTSRNLSQTRHQHRRRSQQEFAPRTSTSRADDWKKADQRFLVRTINEFQSRSTKFKRRHRRPTYPVSPVYLRDIATVVRGYIRSARQSPA